MDFDNMTLTSQKFADTITSLIAAKQTVTIYHKKRDEKEGAVAIFIDKTNSIYSADKTFLDNQNNQF